MKNSLCFVALAVSLLLRGGAAATPPGENPYEIQFTSAVMEGFSVYMEGTIRNVSAEHRVFGADDSWPALDFPCGDSQRSWASGWACEVPDELFFPLDPGEECVFDIEYANFSCGFANQIDEECVAIRPPEGVYDGVWTIEGFAWPFEIEVRPLSIADLSNGGEPVARISVVGSQALRQDQVRLSGINSLANGRGNLGFGDVLRYTWSVLRGTEAAELIPVPPADVLISFDEPGQYTIELLVEDGFFGCSGDFFPYGTEDRDEIDVVVLPGEPFQRGDVNLDMRLEVSDAVSILLRLIGGLEIGCEDAADVDDSGRLDLSDAIILLQFLYRGGTGPDDPWPACGRDPSVDGLDCKLSPAC